jgi:hypothetical protein
LTVFLISPSGTRIELFSAVGGRDDDFIDTELDDEAATSIVDGSAPFTGAYRPAGDLGILDGHSVQGTWALEVTDTSKRNTGTLNSWSLIVEQGNSLLATATDDPADEKTLTDGKLTWIVQAAETRLLEAGIADAADLEVLKHVRFEVRDLPGASLGMTTTDGVFIDSDAAGHGWFVDPSPDEDSEFSIQSSATRLIADPKSAAYGRFDLLTVTFHEIGHLLGFGHTHDPDTVMSVQLSPGSRVLPGDLSGDSSAVPPPAYDPMDVNRDGWITPLDALLLINHINRQSFTDGHLDAEDLVYDANRDDIVTPLDVLHVINFLNSSALGQAEGEDTRGAAPAAQRLGIQPAAGPSWRSPRFLSASRIATVFDEADSHQLDEPSLLTANGRIRNSRLIESPSLDAANRWSIVWACDEQSESFAERIVIASLAKGLTPFHGETFENP